jgi:predicted DNA-binding protein (UPF0251 family)
VSEASSNMSPEVIAWMAAEAEPPKSGTETEDFWRKDLRPKNVLQQENASPEPKRGAALDAQIGVRIDVQSLPTHQFPATTPVAGQKTESGGTPAASDLSAAEVESEVPQEPQTSGSQTQESQIQEPEVQESGIQESEIEGAQDAEPTVPQAPEELGQEEFRDEDRERRIYRRRTVAMLHRYLRYSIETGRLPSLLGTEFFRAKVTSYSVSTFEDRVIFVHDMEICLAKLDEFSRQVLARVVLQDYEQEEAARLLGCTRMTVHRRLLDALDLLSYILLQVGLLDDVELSQGKSCQGGEGDNFFLSDCEQDK